MAETLDPATLFRSLGDARGVVLAVSGGPDSTALMHLAAAWRPSRLPMHVASVDHGLRDGSREVAETVVAQATTLGLSGRVLIWTGVKPERGLQAKARAARHALLEAFALEVGASHLALAHTLDDQAETVLMRLAAGSGLTGLGGMRTESGRQSLVLSRPLLAVGKDALVDLCRRENWPFVVDPANGDPRFARARWRKMAPMLAREGLTAQRLRRLAARLARADEALDEAAARATAGVVVAAPNGERWFDAAGLLALPDEIVLRVLDAALAALCPEVPLRLDRLEDCVIALRLARSRQEPLRRTLRGCLLALDGKRLTLRREPQRHRGRAESA